MSVEVLVVWLGYEIGQLNLTWLELARHNTLETLGTSEVPAKQYHCSGKELRKYVHISMASQVSHHRALSM